MHASPSGWDAGIDTPARRAILPPGLQGTAFAAALLVMSWLGWLAVTRDDAAVILGSDASESALTATAAFALVSRIAAQLFEAGFYTALWRSLGRRVRFGQLFVGIAVLSSCDAVANVLVRGADGDPSPLVIVFAGLRAVSGLLATEAGVRVAFGGLGLLALLRIAGTAWVQSRDGVPMRAALALTGGAWLAGRLVTWWTTDLARGMSPLP